jgi:hypothetical protein
MGRKSVGSIGALLASLLLGTTMVGSARAATNWPLIHSSPASITDLIKVRPGMGPGGTQVRVKGYITPHPFCPGAGIRFVDSAGAVTFIGSVPSGSFHLVSNIPQWAAFGDGEFRTIPRVFDRHFHRCRSIFGPQARFVDLSHCCELLRLALVGQSRMHRSQA